MQQDVIEFAIELVRACGEQLRRVSTVTPEYKTDFQDLVTESDRSMEEQMHHALNCLLYTSRIRIPSITS